MHAQYFALINLNWNIQIWKNQLPAQILYPVTIPAIDYESSIYYLTNFIFTQKV